MKFPKKKKSINKDIRQQKIMYYGQPGAGKSTIASKHDDAIFIATEPGLNHLECHTFENEDGTYKIMKDWNDIKSAIKLLCTEDHQYKTIVIDTVDNAYEACAQNIMRKLGIAHESEEGFGKAYNQIAREFKRVFDRLASTGMGLVFISHEKIGEKEEKNIKRMWIDNTLPAGAKKYINGLVDFIFYCYLDDDENRWMRSRASLNIMAKDRTGKLPEIIAMDYNLLLKHLMGGK